MAGMCGLVGVLAPRGADRPLLDHVGRMAAAIAHRGPDDDGSWRDDEAGLALAHLRLAIVDLSSEGHQPMVSADGRWVLAFNGEIYDHAEHRRRLLASGARFRGHSDTEVLLELVARQGPAAALRSVDGMFALALWDRRDRVLTLARDRVGEKPLLYGRVGQGVAVASELRAIRCLPGAPRGLDREAVAEYLRFGFVPAPHSILDGIRKVPPGCTVQIRADGAIGEPEPFWSLRDVAAAAAVGRPAAADWADQVEDALRRSIARRLMADVPVGAFLSGGLDSSTVVALAQLVSGTPVRTFTVAVGGSGDESAAAAAVAAHLGTEHTTLDLPESAALDLATRMASVYDEPFADPSGIPTAVLCAATRQHVTVALSGDGADELFGGYNRYRVAGSGGVGRLLSLPAPARRALARGMHAVPPDRWDRAARRLSRSTTPAVGDKVHKLAAALRAPDRLGAYSALARIWEPDEVLVGAAGAALAPAPGPDGLGLLDAMLLADQQVVLPDDMLVKVDRASMAVALEVRVPFLSPELVELSWAMPDAAKISDGRGKQVVREVLARHVPPSLWDRPKTGFDPPLASWLRGPLREWAGDLLATERLARQGLLRPDVVRTAWDEHLSGRRNHDYRLWTLLMLQTWLEHADAPTAELPAGRAGWAA
jgi:asparagine synthase (glutamine-hydrolysing)